MRFYLYSEFIIFFAYKSFREDFVSEKFLQMFKFLSPEDNGSFTYMSYLHELPCVEQFQERPYSS